MVSIILSRLTALTISCVFLGVIFPSLVRIANSRGWIDRPGARHKHTRPVAAVGGLGIFSAMLIGVLICGAFEPSWFSESFRSIAIYAFVLAALIGIGLWDDHKGMKPLHKLALEFPLAAVLLVFVPGLHASMLQWQDQLGWWVWGAAAFWLVGVTNAINLIDGMDGLAGGMSALMGGSILTLSALYSGPNHIACVFLPIFLGAIIVFLASNWNPAAIFLGDNGSLPIGFLLGSLALTARDDHNAINQVLSLSLIFGYPIFDMALCVRRRYMSGLPIFVGDRAHTHYRLERLGLSTRACVSLLLMIGVVLQLGALWLNEAALIGKVVITGLCFGGLFGFFQWIRVKEREGLHDAMSGMISTQSTSDDGIQRGWALKVSLRPILEANFRKGREFNEALIADLKAFLTKQFDVERITFLPGEMTLAFMDRSGSEEALIAIRARLIGELERFLAQSEIECTLHSLPIRIEAISPKRTSKGSVAA